MKKILIIFGTRPEAIKMAPVIRKLGEYPNIFKTVVVVTAQHRQMLDQFLELFSISPDYDLNIMTEDQSLSDISAKALLDLERILAKEEPDMVLVQGDTTTTFIGALVSFYHRIPVGHIEAGLRTHDRFHPYPEEVNRRLTAVVSDFHFAPTDTARDSLIREGVKRESIYVIGNTVIDALLITLKKNYKFSHPVLKKIDFNNKKVILVTAHRRENFGRPLENICYALQEIARNNPQVEIVYPVHLNPNVQRTVNKILKGIDRIYLIEPLNYLNFVQLMDRSYLILTDSGGIQEEAPSLGKPVLVLREVSERPEAIEAGTVKLVGSNRKTIIRETEHLLHNKKEYDRMARAYNPYGDGRAAERIIEILKRTTGPSIP